MKALPPDSMIKSWTVWLIGDPFADFILRWRNGMISQACQDNEFRNLRLSQPRIFLNYHNSVIIYNMLTSK